MNSFADTLVAHGLALKRSGPRVLQLNLGRACNLTCNHCHVSAGPTRTESMGADVAERCLDWIRRHRPSVVDLTGGEPELSAQFRRLARGARELGAEVLVRTNLTIMDVPGHEDMPRFCRDLELHVIASMPCYLQENVDAQRGAGAYARSIAALKALNAEGYGRDPRLQLDLVYNPGGPAMPPDQRALEADYRRELGSRHGVVFDRLLCLANLPVGRFATRLRAMSEAHGYELMLRSAFNPAAVAGLMCRDTISVGWRGDVYDCDFNQMMDMPMAGGPRRYLWDLEPSGLEGQPIAVASHCFGCTAGAGSSCGGALT